YDVAEAALNPEEPATRRRLWDQDRPDEMRKMRLVRTIDIRPEADEEPDVDEQEARRRYWSWYVTPRDADDDGSQTARDPLPLAVHLKDALHFASELVKKLELREPEATAVKFAAWWHDQGKDRRVWQRSIGNHDYPG